MLSHIVPLSANFKPHSNRSPTAALQGGVREKRLGAPLAAHRGFGYLMSYIGEFSKD